MISSRFRWNESTVLELSRANTAFIYYRHTRYNLLTGYPETYPLQGFLDSLEGKNLQDKVKGYHVYHFYYELGLVLQGQGHSVGDDVPLAIEIVYESSRKTPTPQTKLSSIPLKTLERPTWTEYKEAFKHIQEQLHAGNAYQVNVTYPFDFETDENIDPRDISSFFFAQKGLGAFAHSTLYHDQMILSNSPECLFQLNGDEVFTMPIKGTLKRKGTLKEDWKELLNSEKDEAELLMITDLLKNDLNRLDRPKAKVIRKRSALEVPGLLHQYSLLSVKLQNKVSLLHALNCLFPGGSVTGAPKKRVMQIIQDVERARRGIYCGSTLLCYGDKKIASINIRTAEIDLSERIWRYGAGGGITLGSNPVHEYQEMEAKVASFLTLIKAPGFSPKPE